MTSSSAQTGLLPLHPTLLSIGYLVGFLSCVGLLAAAYYFEYVLYLDPCPLCIMQRIATLAIGLGCLAAFFTRNGKISHLIALVFILASAIFGTWVADHHVWIQGLPADQVPSCGTSLEYMIETLPLNELITTMLRGNGSCADVVWSFWGLSMPEWTRIWFFGFVVAAVVALASTFKRR
ncbi:disulfide bond formation protein B [Thalassolituus oleivorans]|jgi:disulfide bond formation protein DsbB|uniref:disulfide bond formation protein B n=1 Tax=Thalassolituus oleivorans TaxID=187493 RepID=UPI001CE3A636|nr:disulfide bond formation protein B [Thalassolituus oleivorans]MCA6126901.1 disulfide bond formation protein DsbB [Thalassolituus oleivorans 4BN06-13]